MNKMYTFSFADPLVAQPDREEFFCAVQYALQTVNGRLSRFIFATDRGLSRPVWKELN